MQREVINTMFMSGGIQAQLVYDEYGIEQIEFYKHTYPVSAYYASTILGVDKGNAVMLDDGLGISIDADQVEAVKEMMMEHVIAKFCEDTDAKIYKKINGELDERGLI